MANDHVVASVNLKESSVLEFERRFEGHKSSALPRSFNGFSEITSFLWGVADLLRGDYKPACKTLADAGAR